MSNDPKNVLLCASIKENKNKKRNKKNRIRSFTDVCNCIASCSCAYSLPGFGIIQKRRGSLYFCLSRFQAFALPTSKDKQRTQPTSR